MSLSSVREITPSELTPENAIDGYGLFFPEHFRLQKLGAEEIKGMTKRALLLGKHLKSYSLAQNTWSGARYQRFIDPKEIPGQPAESERSRIISWLFSDPNMNPGISGPGLLEDPVYKFMRDSLLNISHAFTSAEYGHLQQRPGRRGYAV